MALKRKTRATAKAALDREFSRYIRLRDSDPTGWGTCITCRESVFWKDADAGHFVSRTITNTRWDPRNVNMQCKGCNMSPGGRQWEHGNAIDAKFGDGTAAELTAYSRCTVKLSQRDIETLIGDMRRVVLELELSKQI